MKTNLLFLSVLLVNISFSQEKSIRVFNSDLEIEKFIEEGKRIRLKTNKGKIITGKFKIIDEEKIAIRKDEVNLSEVIKIKHHYLAMTLPINTLILGTGIFSFGAGLYIIFASVTLDIPIWFGLAYMGIGTGAITGGILSPNVLRAHKKKNGWAYEIVTHHN